MIIVLVAVIALGMFVLVTNNTETEETKVDKLGLAYTTEGQAVTLIGSAANLESFPVEASFNNTTTTDALLLDGGDTIYQAFKTEGINEGLLCYQLKAGSATSTWNLIHMGSYDGTNYFDVASSTDVFNGTSTDISLDRTAMSFDPGIATTTGQCRKVDVRGYTYTRLIMWGEDLAADGVDGVQGWVQWIPIDERQD